MTRHNLATHISWLLSQVTPSADVSRAAPAIQNPTTVPEIALSNILEEEHIDEEISILSPTRNLPFDQSVNVVQDFARPSVPVSIPPKSQASAFASSLVEGSMGKLKSASRSNRPSLLSQHQLATPASTTTSTLTSTAGPSSLTGNYAAFLRASKDTPSRKTTDRLLPKSARQLHTPQTPRHTPRPPLQLKTENVESVDLTGDNQGGDLRSSSNEIVFGDPVVLWQEGPASRPEPLPRTSKKRKSDEISFGTPGRWGKTGRPAKEIKKDLGDSQDGFVDIDDFDPDQYHQKGFQESPAVPVKPGIEDYNANNGLEEYHITETVSITETRTRKGISRVPSVSEGGPSKLVYSTSNVTGRQEHKSLLEPKSLVQVEASPARGAKSSGKHALTPWRQRKMEMERTIQDSDDDEILSDVEKRVSCSPRPSIKQTPRVVDVTKNSGRHEIPAFEQIDQEVKDTRSPKPRIGSPLRPISRNVATRKDSAPSPFQRDSPTKVSTVSKSPAPPSSQQRPSSTLTDDDKKLVNLFLKHPHAISTYLQRIDDVLAQSAAEAMALFDNGELPPRHLKEERKKFLEMKGAYESLYRLEECHRSLIVKKKDLAREMCKYLDAGKGDTGNLDEQISALTQEIRKTEKEIGHNLHVSDAIKDGFGTEEIMDLVQGPPPASLRTREGTAPLPSGASTIGSAQVILQTQIPSLPQKSVSGSNQRILEEPLRHSSRDVLDRRPSNITYRASPSPVRQQILPKPTVEQQIPFAPREEWGQPERGMRQPNFNRDPSPYAFDDEAFEDLLREDQELQEMQQKSRVEDIEDEYGNLDDDDDMLEITQEIEKRHPLPGPSKTSARKAVSETSGNNLETRNRSRPSTGKNMYSHVDLSHSNLFKYPWSNDVKKALKERFKLTGFRYHQLEAINATLNGEDAFVLMPTGGGKSLCYQLPAVVQSGKTKGVTIVISPLLSLMIDQVGHLKDINIRAATLNGEISTKDRNEIYDQLSETHPEQYIQLLYITPEMVNKSERMLSILSRLHANKKLARIVIDEAHCVSQWGHDFRPDYVALSAMRQRFPKVPLMALTATATEGIIMDVKHNLGMAEKCPVYSQSFNRPNLHYEVRSKKGKGKSKEILDDIVDLIKNRYRGQTGIIYTLSRKNCEQMATKLSEEYGIKAYHYHASLQPDEKKAIQDDWQKGVLQVVVATIAFGMGIDKPDVRFVIHHTIPKSLEGYYQETGRAGRDGKKSGCYLYYGYQDTAVLKDFIYKSEGSDQQKERQRQMLTSMVNYCENRTDCRRVQVLAYFGEKTFTKEECQLSCDNCNSDAVFELTDFTAQATAAMHIVKQVQDSHVTLLHCVDILRGANNAKIKSLNHHQLKQFGMAKDMIRSDIERLFFRLLMENALAEHNIINKSGFASQYLNLGLNCRDFLAGTRKVSLQIKASGSPLAPVRRKQTANSGMLPSTHFTSPISSPSKGKRKATRRPANAYDEDNEEPSDDDFVVDDDDEEPFAPMRSTKRGRAETPRDKLGPPITGDERLASLPELHRIVVHQFVDEAKALEERIRNKTEARKPFFTEAHFREMVIRWTTTISAMQRIPSINADRVAKYGSQILPLVKRYHQDYEDMMNVNQPENRDMDKNHQTVIDLVSEEEEEDFGLDDSDDEAVMGAAEEGSKYFQNTKSSGKGVRKLPWSAGSSTKPSNARGGSSSRGGSNYSARGRGGKKKGSRKSYGSGSGQSTSGVYKRRSSSGPKKHASKSTYTSGSSGNSNLMRKFGNNGGEGGGGPMGRIGMMPP
ncbi:hypothetical protein G7Y89_g7601 [Cudoniella acicularis]|uniref:DNA 3'-5' helicase n=1 Tax=Cudoniella acicularis TaxID=354080 RepID=A0A8H4RKG8_9HELO|nr:hypothetical protein G7Y89_g7601 [Cudoniella acicularis]